MVLLSSSGHGIIGSGIALAIVASVAVVLRLVAKRVAKRATQGGIATDDYWIIFAATTFWVYVGVELWGIYVGAGGANLDNLRTMDPPALAIFFKSIQVNISFLAVTMTGVKLSLLSLYDRLFPLRWFRRAIVVLSGICVVWLLALVLCSVFVCFDQSDDHCVDFSTFYLVLSLVGVLMEITILGLPIRIIIGLQMPARDRILLVFTFLLGGFVCITGIVRLAVSYRPGDQFDIMKCMLWSNIQLGAAIPCACLCTYRPLLSKTTLFSFFSSSFSSSSSSSSSTHNQPASTLHQHPRSESAPEREADETRQPGMAERDPEWPLSEVRAKSPVEIV